MKSPIRARGSVTVPASHDGAPARVMAFQLSRSLGGLGARNIDVGEESVSFNAALLRVVWGWSLLKAADYCRVKVKTTKDSVILDYELRLLEAPVLALALSLVVAAPPLLFFGEKTTAVAALLVFGTLFGGMHHLLIQWRFQRFLRRTLRRANRRTMPPP